MLSRNKFCTGVFYSYDYWNHYWEGSLNRGQREYWYGHDPKRFLHGQLRRYQQAERDRHCALCLDERERGRPAWAAWFPGFSIAAKYKLISLPVKRYGALRGIAVLSGAVPMTDYSPDLQPLSLGTHGKRIAGRAIANYLGRNGLYINGTAAYTIRGNVKLDRSSYYTNGQLYLSNEVAMPNQFDYTVSAGYRKNDMTLTGIFEQQQTRGGGDIRRQDAPFVSNRVNFSKTGFTITYPLPRVRDLGFWLIYSDTFNGRNVGQASTFTTGFLYTFDFERKTRP